MEDTSPSPPVGASVWDRQMFTYLTEHTRLEGAMLEEYVATAEGTPSKALAYLVNLLVEDEHRHHRLFNELASSLKSEAELSGVEPVIPRLDLRLVDSADLLATTRRLLEHEQSDAAELKRLHKDLRDLQDTTLWGLLVEIMQRDTQKHIAILRFVADHAKGN
ncbi:MAG TPA: hypothetical protein VHN36_20265 [Ilumatobacteraceae bacterium]|nr:hypothetical protein [Ilumatobacteraceae bacterium]